MKTSMFIYKKTAAILFFSCFAMLSRGQSDTTFIKRIAADTSVQKMNMDAVYDRPFLLAGKLPIAIGGYLEANTQYSVTDGVAEPFSFQMRRFTLFFSSTVSKKIKFLSEIEFEDGTKEINIEFAAIDMEFHPMLNFRGGIVMNPIGAFNQNHDGPKWDFIDRPLSATKLIPSTLANVGFGLHGKYFSRGWALGYETYLTNGFDDQIVSNTDGRVSLAAGKANPSRFEESNSGLPMFTGKLAVRNYKIGEIGVSYMSGVYNKWRQDGIVLDSKRTARVLAVDFNTSLLKNRINITGEIADISVDVPETYSQDYGTRQIGGFVDVAGTVLKKPILGWEKAIINLVARFDYVDYNRGEFRETGGNISDHVWAFVPGIAFRPAGSTVLRLNYRYGRQTDLLGNPPASTGLMQFGFSSYF